MTDRCSTRSRWTCVLALAWVAGAPFAGLAILFDTTSDPAANTTAPTGTLAASGWRYEGRFSSFLGTAIDPHFFLTAKHIGGDTNTAFTFDGTNYFPDASYDDPGTGSDLRLWHVPERLPRHAPLYTGTNESGAGLIAFGRGTQRGNLIMTDGITNGWYWGPGDGVLRWGSNAVTTIATVNGADYLYATFDHGAGPDECHLSEGDSGGASFAFLEGRWLLAGIHWSVDGYFSQTNSGGFNAAIYDAMNLYVGQDPSWTLVTDHVPSGFYDSRISSHYDWLTNVVHDLDSDDNGIPDWWEARYSGAIHGLTAEADPDGDGASNLQEWLAGTDPTNAASRLAIAGIGTASTPPILVFQGLSNRLYHIDACLELSGTDSWSEASSNAINGANQLVTWTDTTAALPSNRFYRIRADTAP